jgi:superoxide dismutase, Cu-Zn family
MDRNMKCAFYPLAAMALIAGPASAEVLGIGKTSATALIVDQAGVPIGKAKVKRGKKYGLRVTVAVRGLTRGEHGIHLHTIGRCEGPGFQSAGLHWNPTDRLHGLQSEGGSHHGDLPNLQISRKGRGKISYDIADGHVKGDKGLVDGDGGAIVIHAKTDDQRTDPSGNSGDRIACGVFLKD